MYIYPWRESTAYILISRSGGGLFIATLWGLLLWTIDGRPVRRATIAKIRRELSELREARRPQAELTEQVDRFNESIESALTDAPGLAGALEMRPPAQIVPLSTEPIESLAPAAADGEKEYRGEFYPVEKPHHGFSLLELLVVIAIIALLIAML